jgi:hypothetical protein
LYFPCREERAKYEEACAEIDTPSEWVKQLFLSFEAFPGGHGSDFYILNKLDVTDKHRVITPVARASSHPLLKIFRADGSLALQMEGNIYVGVTDSFQIAGVPPGGHVELGDDATCSLSIFISHNRRADLEVFGTMQSLSNSFAKAVEEAESAVAINPKR